MLYENQSCPVCKRQFEDGDDIVVCPECGTPHHRECYNLIGHCVNRALHKSDYSYITESAPAAADETEKEEKKVPPFVFPEGASPFPEIGKNYYDSSDAKINGESAGDVAATVRTNVPRFMRVFAKLEATGKKAHWNWGAFIFGPYYLFFRKMYKQAITVFCINVTLSSLLTLLLQRLAPLTYQSFVNLSSSATDTFGNVMSQAEQIQTLPDYSTFYGIVTVYALLSLTVALCVGLFADYIYKETVTDIIRIVDERLSEGASFSAPTAVPEEVAAFSDSQMRRLYLSRKGGTSFWAPVAAYLAMNLISMLF